MLGQTCAFVIVVGILSVLVSPSVAQACGHRPVISAANYDDTSLTCGASGNWIYSGLLTLSTGSSFLFLLTSFSRHLGSCRAVKKAVHLRKNPLFLFLFLRF